MQPTPERYRAALEQARLGPGECRLFRPRLTLFADRVALSGWTWRGRYRRDVGLDEIADARAVGPDRLDLLLTSGERVPLSVPAAAHWRREILAYRDVAR